MNELSDKTWGLKTRSFGVIWLTEGEALLAQAAYRDGAEFLDVDDLLVARGDIAGFAKGDRLRGVERSRQGEYLCEKHNNWIPKGKTCGYCGTR